MWWLAVWVAFYLTLTLTGSAAAAETLWGLTTENTLVRFSSTAPGTILATVPITGLAGGERMIGIEVETQQGRLTGVSNTGRRYEISRTTGATVQLNPDQAVIALPGAAFGVTENFAVLLVVSESGGVVSIWTTFGEQNSRPPFASNRFVALAWRPLGNTGDSQRVAIDSATDALYALQDQAASYVVSPLGPLGVDTSDEAGLDFGPHDGVLYAALTVGGAPGLYTVDPVSGGATLVGAIAASPVISLTADLQGMPFIIRQNPPANGTGLIPEPNATAAFTVRRTGDDTVAADYVVSTMIRNDDAPPATPGDDFVPVSETLHFAAGELEKTVTVTTRDDGMREADERLTLAATETGPGNRAFGWASLIIVDDDNLPPVLTMTFPASPTVSVASPAVTLSGLASDEDPGVSIKLFGSGGVPYIPLATTTGSPWTFADVPLQPGLNGFRVVVEDIHGSTATSNLAIWRESAEDRTYVFAEGATGAFFTTELLFANPHAQNVSVIIDFLREDGAVISHPLSLPALRRTTLTVNTIPGLEATATAAVVRALASYPIVVERTMRWDASGYGASTEKASSEPSRTWYFAEGSQGVFFSTFLLLVNPRDTPNDVTVRFLREGAGAVTKTYAMLPRQRLTIDARAVPELTDSSFGIEVSFTDPGMAERSMYFGRNALWDGGHESAGAATPATDWLLAEGATGEFFETFVLVANPSNGPADVTMTFLPEGGVPVTRTHQVPANGRLTVNIEQEDASLANLGAVGTRLTSTTPVVVERSQYWPFSPDRWYEAHNSFGETAAAAHWGLAEGRVGGAAGYRTYVLLTNPDPAATAHVTMTFLRESDEPVIKSFNVTPASRLTIDVGGAQAPEITGGTFGADIVSDVPIAVERAMYSNANGQFWAAGTNAAATRLP